MLAKLARLGFLVVAAALAAGSTTQQGRSPQYPYRRAPSPYTQGSGRVPPGAVFVCTVVNSKATIGSFCYPTQERCDRERVAIVREGAQASQCRPLAPVACFQLGGDPDPSKEACAETLKDCELLRWIDQDKNGSTGATCE